MYCANTQGAELSKVALFTGFLRKIGSLFLSAIPQFIVGKRPRLYTFLLLSLLFILFTQQVSYAQDTDGDGVVDALDLDDDNDGLLDTSEGCAIEYASVIASSLTVDNVSFILGAPDGLNAEIYSNGDQVTLDFGQVFPAGTVYEFTWKRQDGRTDQAIPQILESTDNANFTLRTNNPSTTTSGYRTELLIAENAFRYLRFTKTNPPAIADYDIDAVGVLVCTDSDSDGIPDRLDLDSDNDGLTDIVEVGGNDTDGNGRVDSGIPTVNVDGVPVNAGGGAGYTALDSDLDGVANFVDLDSDNDGLTDIAEVAGNDSDGNGRVDSGIPVINADGIPVNAAGGAGYAPLDRDVDGVSNFLDLDADNDGVTDILEAGGIDTNEDGRIDGFLDSDGDGLDNSVDLDNGGTPLPDDDLDADALENRLDIDADGDGIIDLIESQSTTATPLAPGGVDTDGDGLDDAFDPDNGGTYINPINTDGTDTPDYLDTDSDNDTNPDQVEGYDTDGDGTANTLPSGADSDTDGLDDNFDFQAGLNATTNPSNNGQNATFFPKITTITVGLDRDWRTSSDTDGDGIDDSIDLDDDNDGILDTVEDGCTVLNALNYEFYRGVFTPSVDNIPFTGAIGTGIAVDFDVDALQNAVDPSGGGDDYGIRYTGFIVILTDETYTFYTNSDDGSKLFVDGVEVVDNDGDHAANEEQGTIALTAGTYSFAVEYYENGGNVILEVSYETPTIAKTQIPFTAFRTSTTCDNDLDGRVRAVDLDSDNDGIPDAVEAGGTDPDGNGILGTGILTFVGGDVNSDGVPLAANGGLGFTPVDTDIDGLEDYVDVDSDNDGITDIREAGGIDDDFDGRADNITDTDNDGYVDLFDTDNAGTPLADNDLDSDGLVNRIDIDSDGDGIIDLIEAQVTSNAPVVPIGADTDGDGLDNQFDINDGGTAIVPINTDAADDPDYLDLDTDNDSRLDLVEGYDTDGDGVPETVPSGSDSDGDGLDDNFDLQAGRNSTTNPANGTQTAEDFPGGASPNWRIETDVDTDGDGFVNSVDLDDDNDGILDTDECTSATPTTSIFTYTGADQTYNVPLGAEILTIKVWGAGGRGDTQNRSVGGAGGYSEISIPVSALASTNLTVTVGEGGNSSTGAVTYGNGGAGLINGSRNFGSGGGMSAVSTISLTNPGVVSVNDLIVIAGGGGTAPAFTNAGFTAGSGGGLVGSDATDSRADIIGGGGTQSAGGTSFNGNPGSFLQGGNAIINGGAGGGGYYGGGSGSFVSNNEGSGGGGSGYLSPLRISGFSAASPTTPVTQDPPNNTDPNYVAGVGRGGNNNAGNGGNGLVVITANFEPCNADADALADQFDLDSDNDGILDIIEAGGIDPDGDGRPGTGVPAVDGNGVPTLAGAAGYGSIDTDSDGVPNYQDIDSDGDGIIDLIESQGSTGTPNVPIGTDADNDGIDNTFDVDIGGTPTTPIITQGVDADYVDLDTDNDGLVDNIEGWDTDGDYIANTLPSGSDADGDGLDDAYDNVTGPNSTTNPTNGGQSSNDFPDVTTASLTLERDWRESNVNNCQPGGVNTNLLLWIKADEGGVSWRDVSNNFVSVVSTGSPDGSALMNFNPTNTFDGGDFYTSTLDASADTYTDLAVIGVYQLSQDNAGAIWGEEDGGFDRFILDGAGANENEAVSNGTGTESDITGLATPNVTTLSTVIFDDAQTDGTEVFINGGSARNFTVNHAGQTTNNFQVGALGNSTRLYNGQISEIIVFNQLLTTATERQQIESYLSLKWGITLTDDTDGNGTPLEPGEGDYLFSNGTVLWDADEDAIGYQNNVAGIVRDDLSCLEQKMAKSENADAIVTIGLQDANPGQAPSNAANIGTFAADRIGLVWGHDGAALYDNDENIDFDPLQVRSRLNREWRVQRVGAVGTVTVTYEVANLLGPTGIGTNDESQIVLLVDADGDFSAGASIVFQTDINPGDGLVNFDFDFPDGTYFTLASSEFAALPVSLVSFDAESFEDHVLLQWETANETDNDRFRIESASNGVDFKTLGFVSGAGTTNLRSNYSFRDFNPHQGVNYYRLVDIDLAGIENFSEIVRVYYEGKEKVSLPYPNPVARNEWINLSIPDNARVTSVIFFSRIGKQLQAKYKIERDLLKIETDGLIAGVYLMKVVVNGEVVSRKVMIN